MTSPLLWAKGIRPDEDQHPDQYLGAFRMRLVSGAVPGTSCFNKRQTLKFYYEVPPALVTDKEKLLS